MNLPKFQDKRVLYILVGTLVVLFVLLLTLISRKQRLEQQIATQTPPTGDTSAGKQIPISNLPKTVFSEYTLNATLPSLPTSVKLADLKTSYTTGEALDLATKIGFKKAIVDDGVNLVLVTDQAEGPQALLSLNKASGNFLFTSEGGFPSGVSGADPTSIARSFLSKLG